MKLFRLVFLLTLSTQPLYAQTTPFLTDDDLWQIDQTQLKRNNFIIGGMAYFLYRAVFAEAQAAWSWYYGMVRLEDVVKTLDAAVLAGAITLKGRK